MTVSTGQDAERFRPSSASDVKRRQMKILFRRLGTQWRVIRALIIRDMMSRYGRENIGFLWLIAEPVFLIGGVIVLWSILRGESTHGFSVIAFALTGYSMLTLWRHMIGRGPGYLRGNTGILFHQNVRILDTACAQILMETISTFLSFLFCFILLYLLGFVEMVYDPLTMALAWLMMAGFSGGFGMILGAIVAKSKPVERMLQPVMYFTLPVTGAFNLVSWLPEQARKFVVWFPMVNAQEMFRAGFVGPRLTFFYDPWYLFFTTVVCISIGIWMLKRAERTLHVG